jgi:hypothetical protein
LQYRQQTSVFTLVRLEREPPSLPSQPYEVLLFDFGNASSAPIPNDTRATPTAAPTRRFTFWPSLTSVMADGGTTATSCVFDDADLFVFENDSYRCPV